MIPAVPAVRWSLCAAIAEFSVGKCSFDVQLTRPLTEPDRALDIGFVRRRIDDIDDALPRSDPQRMPPQLAEADCAGIVNDDRDMVGISAAHRLLGVVQPRTDRQAEHGQPVPPYVDLQPLLQGERETRNAMVENHGLDPELVFDEHEAVRQRRRLQLPRHERIPGGKTDPADDPAIEFVDRDREIDRSLVQ